MKKYFPFRFFFASKYASLLSKKTYLEHPGMCLEVGAAVLAIHQRKLVKIAIFAFSSLKNEPESWFGEGAQPANEFFSEVGRSDFGLNTSWCCANFPKRSGQLFFPLTIKLANLRVSKFKKRFKLADDEVPCRNADFLVQLQGLKLGYNRSDVS